MCATAFVSISVLLYCPDRIEFFRLLQHGPSSLADSRLGVIMYEAMKACADDYSEDDERQVSEAEVPRDHLALTSFSSKENKTGRWAEHGMLLPSPCTKRCPKVENSPHKIIEKERIACLGVPQIKREGPLRIMAANQDLGKFDDGRQSRDSRRQEDGVLQHIFAAQRSLEKVAKKNKGSKTPANDEK